MMNVNAWPRRWKKKVCSTSSGATAAMAMAAPISRNTGVVIWCVQQELPVKDDETSYTFTTRSWLYIYDAVVLTKSLNTKIPSLLTTHSWWAETEKDDSRNNCHRYWLISIVTVREKHYGGSAGGDAYIPTTFYKSIGTMTSMQCKTYILFYAMVAVLCVGDATALDKKVAHLEDCLFLLRRLSSLKKNEKKTMTARSEKQAFYAIPQPKRSQF